MCSVIVAIQTGALPSKVRVVSSNPLPGTGRFFLPFFSSTFFPSFPYTARLPSCMHVCGQGPAHLSGGPTSTINIPVVVYLAYGSTVNFQFRGPIAKINISKEREGYSDRSGPRILETDPVILKLSRFSQVQSERERTLVPDSNGSFVEH